MEADSCSIVMCSNRRFFQMVMLIFFLDFQFIRMVFLAMVGAMGSILQTVMLMLMFDMSPNKQSAGDGGMWQLRRMERKSVMLFQNCFTGVQTHVACK